VRFELLTARIIKIMVFRYGPPCSVPTFGRNVLLPSSRPENVSRMLLSNSYIPEDRILEGTHVILQKVLLFWRKHSYEINQIL
jgi:hypothetical protein